MKVSVDLKRCQSNAICMSIAPNIFEVREDGYLYILNDSPGPADHDDVLEAVEACPTQAISVEE
ncbi:MAG: ferredoxin [Acidimicrobiaceae bacterium]|nr:ferredoxin [Acidimicrobiaceae bacterium]